MKALVFLFLISPQVFSQSIRVLLDEGQSSFELFEPESGQKIELSCPQKDSSLEVQTELALKYKKEIYKGKFSLHKKKSGKCDLVLKLPFDDYLASVIPKEVNKSWPLDLLKAQAVASRSYAWINLKKERGYFDVRNDVLDQVSGGITHINEKVRQAVSQTSDEFLTHRGRIVQSFFHARCGGKTGLPSMIWSGRKSLGYKGVNCSFCHGDTAGKFSVQITSEKWKEFLKSLHINIKKFKIRDSQKRVFHLVAPGEIYEVQKEKLRVFLGRDIVKSPLFSIQKNAQGFNLSGKGHGHGVGMCQMGALDLARSGKNYKEILRYYYPHFKVVKK